MSDTTANTNTNNKNTVKWGDKEKSAWFAEQTIQRSYLEDVVARLDRLKDKFQIEQYGTLPCAPDNYPLFIVKPQEWDKQKPTILVTGGVHGYETSGVHGALSFLETEALNYAGQFNIVVAPCVSPWGYETINRWNPNAIDPNRSFKADSPAEESAALMKAVASLNTEIVAHIDLHETTDTDNTVFRPALAARDGIEQEQWNIPDGFYLVGDTENPVDDFQTSIIESVKKVTHIAPCDEDGKIIGEPITQEGVINYAKKKLGLCAGFTNSQYPTTTEVYPDSPKATDEDCVKAQVAAIKGGLDYLIEKT
ncbi:M14 family metallopeptidase [Aliikangiella coralliicola]|uniref:M14 family metallocarboxypeptidase n=1 Tax=Aliikangiella coralliicola TaxID=2592383 RepID=A0A545UDT7_9GAMM|nr:M14 family metallocarboxypeptidase [Aliikangiella coralliicola]TQV87631.1 M14 family metallocarboxypeptidase [Aliikangiella coralliicola]